MCCHCRPRAPSPPSPPCPAPLEPRSPSAHTSGRRRSPAPCSVGQWSEQTTPEAQGQGQHPRLGKKRGDFSPEPLCERQWPASARRQLDGAGGFCSGDKGGLSPNCSWAAAQPGSPVPLCKQTPPSASLPGRAGCPQGQPGALARLSGDRGTLLSPLLRGKQAQGVSGAEGRHLKRRNFILSAGFFPFRADKAVCAFTAPGDPRLLGNGIKAAPSLRYCVHTALIPPHF